MASRGQSFSLGSPFSSTALVTLKYAGQMLQRPHLENSLTARTADCDTTHSVVHRLHASTPDLAQPAVDAPGRIDLPDDLSLGLADQVERAAAQHQRRRSAGRLGQCAAPCHVVAHAAPASPARGSKTKIWSFTVSAT